MPKLRMLRLSTSIERSRSLVHRGRTRRTAPATPPLSVAVIGAGFSGIVTAVKLAKAGFDDVTVFERSAGPGGTWWDNTYPGCEVDVPSHVYSFSFMPNHDWSATHAPQAELQQYAEDVIDTFALRPRFRFGCEVDRVDWDESTHRYAVRLTTGEVRDYALVVSCLGMLNVPKYPEWPGLDDFTGPKFHTARWEHEHDLAGKRVAVVGTGSTAAQVVPALAPVVEQLQVFQREPGWVVPKGERKFTPVERERYRRRPWLARAGRYRFLAQDWRFANTAFEVGSRMHQRLTETSLSFIEEAIEDPAVRAAVTPSYPWGCKRAVVASNFYPTLNRPNVTLIPRAVERVTETGLVDVDGVEHEIDVLVMSTGFQPYTSNLHITGPDGRTLDDLWQGDPRAFLGITVAGLPNFFILFGPNTNGGSSIITQLELQADVVVRTARRMRRAGHSRVDTRPRSMRRFVDWVDRRNHKQQSAGFTGCHNYYFSSTGRNITQWPSSHVQYFFMTRVLPRLALKTKGEASPTRGTA
jgi:cation diffusion facilitator CzcD-associated flavoprotein CzcO